MFTAPLLFVLSLASPQQPAPAPTATATEPSPAVRATNGLGIALYKALDQEQKGKNLFVSPFSITVALAMLAEGAHDETLAELKHALQVPVDTPLDELHASLQASVARYRDGGGNADPALRERIAELRKRFDATTAGLMDAPRDERWSRRMDEAEELAAQINRLLPQVDRYELRVANGLWVERSFPLLPSFVQALDRHYGTGGANNLDFRGNPEAARLRINEWAQLQTERRIVDLLPRGHITASTVLVIANAVFFRGEWAHPFEADKTRDEDFLLADGSRVPTKLMHDTSHGLPYAAFTGEGSAFATPYNEIERFPRTPRKLPKSGEETRAPVEPAKASTYPDPDGFTMIELPYKGGELAMLVLAPRSPDGLPRLEAMLDATSLAAWVGHLREREVEVALPRFEQGTACELRRSLETLGVRRAFAPAAQFGGISAGPNLLLEFVRHQTWIRVDEKGTEAAGVTTGGAAIGTKPFVPVFRADRPFLFLIRDVKSGAILFLGRVVDPRAA